MITSPALEMGLNILDRLRGEVEDRVKTQTVTSDGSLYSRVQEYLRAFPRFPAYSVLMGVCEDGMPLMLDLENPAPGPILLIGKNIATMNAFIQASIYSIAELNTPNQVRYVQAIPNAGSWHHGHPMEYHMGTFDWASDEVESAIMELTGIAEGRRMGRNRGPAIYLALDSLGYASTMNHIAQVNLRWLLRYGAQYRVWVVASYDANKDLHMDTWLPFFKTALIGNLERTEDILGRLCLPTTTFTPLDEPETCQVHYGNRWQKITLPYYL